MVDVLPDPLLEVAHEHVGRREVADRGFDGDRRPLLDQ
jgi:hypothetical protein